MLGDIFGYGFQVLSRSSHWWDMI